MKPLSKAMRAWWLGWMAWLMLGWAPVHGAQAVDPAAQAAQPWLVAHAERAKGAFTGADSAADGGAAWESVSLPDAWRLGHRSGTWTYRLRLPTCGPGASGYCLDPRPGAALWIPRVGCGMELWVNGQAVVRLAEINGAYVNRGLRPILQTIAPSPLRDARAGVDNDVRLVVSSTSERVGGLSRVWVGTEASLNVQHALRDILVTSGAMASLSFSVLMALSGILVALRITPEAWTFVLVSCLWGAGDSLWLIGPRFMAWDLASTLGELASATAMIVSCRSVQTLLDERAPVWQRASSVVLALLPGVIWWRATHAGAQADVLVRCWIVTAYALCSCVTVLTTVWVLRKPSLPRLLMLLGCLCVAAISILDNWHDKESLDPLSFEQMRLTPYMGLCALGVVCVTIYMRVSTALALEGHHKEAMQREIEAQRRELEQLHARERARAQVEAVAEERARLVRDMHDGLGSQLVGMLSTVESGTFTQGELLDELTEALNQLRLTIDSLEPVGEDLSSLLGQLRYRLDARLRKAGFKVMWEVAALPTDAQLSASHINHLQRLLYEAFSNVIKHSRAACVWVHASHDKGSGTNKIVIRDDGCGFESGRPGGRGLSNLAHRAAQLGADLEVRSRPGQGTQVSLSWAVGAA